jgi:class 3 adenylate cyclase
MATPGPDKLTATYFKSQMERSLRTLDRIVARPDPSQPGRIIPDSADLAIHDGRRIDAAVMFLDICKFSQRPCESAQEQLIILQIISLFFTEMIRIIEDYGGVVEKNTGDGLMAYFGPNFLPNVSTQQRALTAALTMFTAAEEIINPLIIRSGLARVDFRICMDQGQITVAKVGAARGFNGIVAVGTTANIASKMLSVAEANTILIGTRFRTGLPQSWVDEFVVYQTNETGWFWRGTGAPYAFWQYTGRWRVPAI